MVCSPNTVRKGRFAGSSLRSSRRPSAVTTLSPRSPSPWSARSCSIAACPICSASRASFSTSYNDFPSRAASRIDASSRFASSTNELPLISCRELAMLIVRPPCQGDLNEPKPSMTQRPFFV